MNSGAVFLLAFSDAASYPPEYIPEFLQPINQAFQSASNIKFRGSISRCVSTSLLKWKGVIVSGACLKFLHTVSLWLNHASSSSLELKGPAQKSGNQYPLASQLLQPTGPGGCCGGGIDCNIVNMEATWETMFRSSASLRCSQHPSTDLPSIKSMSKRRLQPKKTSLVSTLKT